MMEHHRGHGSQRTAHVNSIRSLALQNAEPTIRSNRLMGFVGLRRQSGLALSKLTGLRKSAGETRLIPIQLENSGHKRGVDSR